MGLRRGIAVRSAVMVPVLAIGLLSACGGAANSTLSPPAEVSKAASEVSSRPIRPRELREYLSTWEASWRRLGDDLGSGDERALGFSSTPDASWELAQRLYDGAATAFGDDGR